MSVVIETTVGDITVDLYTSDRPRACLNFLKLCKIKYYNFNLFHTISRGFIAQTGDPSGSRSGGESLYAVLDGPEKRFFEGENEPRIKHTKMGLISFVGNDDRMIGSQFFLTLGEDLTYLDEKHCVFGEVVEGYDVLEILNEIICDNDDRPYQDVRITHTVILDDAFPNPRKLVIPSRSPSPSAERLKGGRIAPDEEIDEFEGKAPQEIAEMRAEREAKARATILEMVGDLPDAEMAPPENVLFVCKLNPVTSDDDLEIIFSRFGKIKSCEVIRDKKTGDSLQYAFVEFEDKSSCENAYFKMDNVLIDDRRIHVDFSQSVSKVKWRGKGRGVTHYNEKGEQSKYADTDIGKGNYKIRKNDSYRTTESRPKNRVRSRSPVIDRKRNSKYKREKSLTPERNKSYYDDYSRGSRNYSKRNRPSISPERNKNRSSPSTFEGKYRSSEKSKKNSRSHRDKSKSYEREKNDYNLSKLRNRSVSPKRQNNSSSRKRSRSLSPKRSNSKRNGQHEKSQEYDKKNTSSTKTSSEKKYTSKNKRENDSDSAEDYNKIKRSKNNSNKYSPKRDSSNSKNKGRSGYNPDEENRVKRNKKTTQKYSSSEDSSSDSDREHKKKKKVQNESSDSDNVKPKSKKKSAKKNRCGSSSDSDNYKKKDKKDI